VIVPAPDSLPPEPVTLPAAAELDLLVVGDLNPDLILRGDVVPRFGQAEQRLTAADLVLAGSAGIVAAGAARLGLRTAIAAHVGVDSHGDLMLEALRARGVDVSAVTRDASGPTGLSVVLSAPGDRAILTLPGCMVNQGAQLPDDVLHRTRHVHLSSYFLLPRLAAGAAELFLRARAAGATTSLDTNWDPDGRWQDLRSVLSHTDVFLPNEAELRALTGQPDLDEAARALLPVVPVLAVKRGADGAVGWDRQAGRVSAAGLPVDVVDSTGAGDSFVAGFLAGRLAGKPLATALRWGCVAGSLSTRAAGGTAAQATRAEVEALG
jgi:sugar/nucleoside kinase (ribokinase family)